MTEQLLRYAAFTADPAGGNPAGVWIGSQLPDEATMQAVAAEIGYSETAYISPRSGKRRRIRYFTPETEVAFCGHATIASAVALGEREGSGDYEFECRAGTIPVQVREQDGRICASLRSVRPRQEAIGDDVLTGALAALRWDAAELDGSIPSMRIFAGLWHLLIAAATKERLDDLDYDFEGLRRVMRAASLDTVQLIWREHSGLYHSRNPCPEVGIVEDPATGSAAAALGGYLRDRALLEAPATILVRQGEVMGRPSRIEVGIPESGGIIVSGTAVPIP